MTGKLLLYSEVGIPKFIIEEIEKVKEISSVFSLSSHKRAREALELGLTIKDPGYNIFVVAHERTGRMSATLAFLKKIVKKKSRPDDWVYLNNFRMPNEPKPYKLPAGIGYAFSQKMKSFLRVLSETISKTLESSTHHSKLDLEKIRIEKKVNLVFEKLRSKIRKDGLDISQTEQGMIVIAIDKEGKPIPIDDLSPEKREELREKSAEVTKKINKIGREAIKLHARFEECVEDINRSDVKDAIEELFNDFINEFGQYDGLNKWLSDMEEDVLNNLSLFFVSGNKNTDKSVLKKRYGVNLFVDHRDNRYPKVVIESNPTYENLFGRIEYRQSKGILETDFTMLRSGSLHQANGGILLLRVESIAEYPMTLEFLKSALRDKEIRIEGPQKQNIISMTESPRPKSIPLDIKVILIGGPFLYHLFLSSSSDFRTYFKVKADIDPDMKTTPENINRYAGLIQYMAKTRNNVTCNKDAIQFLLGVASRWACNKERLTAQFELIEDVLTEATEISSSSLLIKETIKKALIKRRYRNARIEDRFHESISEGQLVISTTGSVVGQINALAVQNLGDHIFGLPMRITARSSIGSKGIVNIERYVKLGGPIQQKSVMVLQGFLSGYFAREIPLSFNSSITFEQNYGGIEGDSASLAELIVILSDLADVPIKQSVAVTGSVNQLGNVQAIGGVHHKVEGFYRTCLETKDNGDEHGVIIPSINEKNLVLRDDVVNSVKDKKFNIWSVETISDALEIITGISAGKELGGKDGKETIYSKIVSKLQRFNEILLSKGK